MLSCIMWLFLGRFDEKRIVSPKTKHERSEKANDIITFS